MGGKKKYINIFGSFTEPLNYILCIISTSCCSNHQCFNGESGLAQSDLCKVGPLLIGITSLCRRKTTNWRAPWKICSTTMKLRKSLVKTVMRQKTCNYNELFGSSAQDRHARHI